MPKLEYFLVAESMSTDQATNNVSLFNILEEISGKFPFVFHRIVAVSCWNFAPEEQGRDFQASLRIHLPGGKRFPEQEDFSVNFTVERRRQRVYHIVHGLKLEEAGDAVFEVLLNGEHQADRVIGVTADEVDA